MADVLNFKCPCCGAPLVFKGETEKLTCDYCENSYTIEQVKEAEAAEAQSAAASDMTWVSTAPAEIRDESGKLTGYSCPSCGAEIVASENTAATECPYCGNKAIIPTAFEGMYKPDCMIPFKLDKSKAEEALKAFYKGKLLLPKEFTSGNRVKEIKGLYVPFWLFDCEAEGSVTYNAVKEKTWKQGNTEYKKKDTYLVSRAGTMDFEKIPVDGSKQMDDAYMDAIEPFDYSAAVEYDSAYFSGYLAEKYDVDSKEAEPRVNERVTHSVKQVFRDSVSGYSSVDEKNASINIKDGKIQYAMMPVWMLTTKYNNENYTFAMNGQTGKLVGKLPTSTGKAVLSFLIVAVVTFLLSMAILGDPIISVIAALIVAGIVLWIMKSSMNTAVKQQNAQEYLIKSSVHLSTKRDTFLYSKTETRKVEQN
ncbi:MAG: hypothetical protein K6F35_01185 [Lachnospiraceae bacterium]|nr:hypothetical protein [Lachnospiraceae bacterium]